MPKTDSHKTGPDYVQYDLVFFSTYEVLNLPIQGPMEDAGVVKLDEPSPIPCLYVALAENMEARIPLIPLALLSGWQCDSNYPPQVKQEQEFRFPSWLCRRSCGGWKAQQQRL